MPLYDYNCEHCGTFEAQRHHTEAGSPAACPQCGGDAARIWTAPVIAATGQPRTFNARRPTEEAKPLQPGSTAFRMPDAAAAAAVDTGDVAGDTGDVAGDTGDTGDVAEGTDEVTQEATT